MIFPEWLTLLSFLQRLARRSRDKTKFLQHDLPAFDQLSQRKAELDNPSHKLTATHDQLVKTETQVTSSKKDIGNEAALGSR